MANVTECQSLSLWERCLRSRRRGQGCCQRARHTAIRTLLVRAIVSQRRWSNFTGLALSGADAPAPPKGEPRKKGLPLVFAPKADPFVASVNNKRAVPENLPGLSARCGAAHKGRRHAFWINAPSGWRKRASARTPGFVPEICEKYSRCARPCQDAAKSLHFDQKAANFHGYFPACVHFA